MLTDLSGARVLEVSEGRDQAGADALWQALSEEQAAQIEAAAVDMWPAYAAAVATHAPQAEIVHDRFHVSKHLNEAVDQVRRQEHKVLKKQGDARLTGSKQLWLFNPENLKKIQGWRRAAGGLRAGVRRPYHRPPDSSLRPLLLLHLCGLRRGPIFLLH